MHKKFLERYMWLTLSSKNSCGSISKSHMLSQNLATPQQEVESIYLLSSWTQAGLGRLQLWVQHKCIMWLFRRGHKRDAAAMWCSPSSLRTDTCPWDEVMMPWGSETATGKGNKQVFWLTVPGFQLPTRSTTRRWASLQELPAHS